MVIALVVTPQGFPLAYEVMPGNTSDKTTLKDFLEQIEAQYGRSGPSLDHGPRYPHRRDVGADAHRPTTRALLGGDAQGDGYRSSKGSSSICLGKPFGPSVDVKLLAHDKELYILARSHPRTLKERSMRRRRLKILWRRLHELQQQALTRDALLLKLGAAKKEAGRAYHLVEIQIPDPNQPVTPESFTFSLRRDKLRTVRRREGRYLLRSNLPNEDPATLWQYYIRLTEIEQAFKELKHDLAIRPIYHQTDKRIEAHIFIAFIAYCLHVTLKQRTRSCAPGTHAARGVGEVRDHANGRRAFAHHRWTSTGLAALHAAGLRPPTPLSAAQAEFAGSASAANLRLSPSSPLPGTVPCSADLWLARTANQHVTRVLAASCGRRAKRRREGSPRVDARFLKGLVVVSGLGVALVVFSVLTITVPRESVVRSVDAAQGFAAALLRAGGSALEGISEVAKDVGGGVAEATQGRVLSGRALVVDGDSLALAGERTQFHGIDAPESA